MKTTYLAVMPRCRKPKAVPKGHVGFYQQKARLFYEARGLSAAEARDAIRRGQLKPTWQDGNPVLANGSVSTEPRLRDLMIKHAEEHGMLCALRIGTTLYQPQWTRCRSHPKYNWHAVDISGIMYNASPMSYGDLERHVRKVHTCELALLHEDHASGVPMGMIVCLAEMGTLAPINSPEIRAKSLNMIGRRFSAVKIIRGATLAVGDTEL